MVGLKFRGEGLDSRKRAGGKSMEVEEKDTKEKKRNRRSARVWKGNKRNEGKEGSRRRVSSTPPPSPSRRSSPSNEKLSHLEIKEGKGKGIESRLGEGRKRRRRRWALEGKPCPNCEENRSQIEVRDSK